MFHELKPYELEVDKLLQIFTFDELLEHMGLSGYEVLEMLLESRYIRLEDIPLINQELEMVCYDEVDFDG